MKNYYEILQVAANASPEVIAASYKALARLHHPDKGGNVDTMREIVEAYEVLKDPQRRNAYDQQRFARDPRNFNQARSGRRGFVPGVGWMDVEDIPPGTAYQNSQYQGGMENPFAMGMSPYPQMAEEFARGVVHEAVEAILERMFQGRFRR